MRRRSIDFQKVARAAADRSQDILARWLPDGKRDGAEWVARNPRRADGRPGSFKINLRSGVWADFATGDKGRDLVALAGYLFDLKMDEAAKRVAGMCGVDPFV